MDRFEIYNRNILGKGSFGEVCLALDKVQRKLVAVKIEKKGPTKSYLKKEAEILQDLSDIDSSKMVNHSQVYHPGYSNIIKIIAFVSASHDYYMFTELYGPNLDTLHRKCSQTFPIGTVKWLAGQMLNGIQYCHSKGILHRDIKPANFMVVFSPPHKKICLCDFGLSSPYLIRSGTSVEHIPYKTDISCVGNMRFMSKHVHRGIQPSRRDDIYSLIYVIIYLPKGTLPWKEGHVKGMPYSQKHNRFYVLKSGTSNKEIANSIGDCDEFTEGMMACLDYLDTLKYENPIDYELIRSKVMLNEEPDPNIMWKIS